MDETIFEVYLINKARHTEQNPVAEWVQLPTDAEKIKAVFERIGVSGDDPSEYEAAAYESAIDGLTDRFRPGYDLDELNYLAALLTQRSQEEREKFAAAMLHGDHAASIADAINLTHNLDCYWLHPTVHNSEDYGHYVVDELDYREKAQQAQRDSVRSDTYELIYENGTRQQPATDYRLDAQPDKELGKFERFEALPNDPDALEALLRSEKQAREQLAPGDIKSHVAELSDRKVMDEAQRIADAFATLPAPNSPNKTHFMVELSQTFLLLANSKEQTRLQAMLPYKSLYLSGMKDRRGIFALINKDENRSLPLRKPRQSVRSQLKDGQTKAAAPKKTAVKKKNNDLEV